jgi:hypothetical protein
MSSLPFSASTFTATGIRFVDVMYGLTSWWSRFEVSDYFSDNRKFVIDSDADQTIKDKMRGF